MRGKHSKDIQGVSRDMKGRGERIDVMRLRWNLTLRLAKPTPIILIYPRWLAKLCHVSSISNPRRYSWYPWVFPSFKITPLRIRCKLAVYHICVPGAITKIIHIWLKFLSRYTIFTFFYCQKWQICTFHCYSRKQKCGKPY
jgi:hypothetical protein